MAKKPAHSPSDADAPEEAEFAGKCFIISRIGGLGTDERREVDGLVDAVITPVLKSFRLEPIVAHRMAGGGSITNQIVTHLLEDELVIANLTGLNPNVMYELAVRHAVRKPIVVLADHHTTLPFDVYDDRVLFYQNDMLGVHELETNLPKFIRDALANPTPDNPIYRASGLATIMESNQTPSADKAILGALQNIERRINLMAHQSPQYPIPSRPPLDTFNFRLMVKDPSMSDDEIATSIDIIRQSVGDLGSVSYLADGVWEATVAGRSKDAALHRIALGLMKTPRPEGLFLRDA